MTLHDPELHDHLKSIVADISVVLLQSCGFLPVLDPERQEAHGANCRTCQLLDKTWALADLRHELARAEAEVLQATEWLLEDVRAHASQKYGWHWKDVAIWASEGEQVLRDAQTAGE